MMSVVIFFVKQIILLFSIGSLYSLSHELLQFDRNKSIPWRRAMIDNASHITLGILSWLVSVSFGKIYQPYNIMCCLLCGLFAGIVDVDHFLMARSFKLDDALNLPSRPPFHNTTLMLLSIVSFIFLMYNIGYLKLSYVGWILLVAVTSHHLRDALHRGLWLWPFHFKPMNSFVCLLLSYSFPLLIGYIVHNMYKPQHHEIFDGSNV